MKNTRDLCNVVWIKLFTLKYVCITFFIKHNVTLQLSAFFPVKDVRFLMKLTSCPRQTHTLHYTSFHISLPWRLHESGYRSVFPDKPDPVFCFLLISGKYCGRLSVVNTDPGKPSVTISSHHLPDILTPSFVFRICVTHCVRIATVLMTIPRGSKTSFTDFSDQDKGAKQEQNFIL